MCEERLLLDARSALRGASNVLSRRCWRRAFARRKPDQDGIGPWMLMQKKRRRFRRSAHVFDDGRLTDLTRRVNNNIS
jgi:hypothetical protein